MNDPSAVVDLSEADDVLEGIEAELEQAAECLEFRVLALQRDQKLFLVRVEEIRKPHSGRSLYGPLDESLEGAAAWWPGPPKGGADVLTVDPESQQLALRFATAEPPSQGGLLRVYPPRYLDALKALWEDRSIASRSLTWLAALRDSPADPEPDKRAVPNHHVFSTLRPAQRDAFRLPGFPTGYLWGPPGTGKTTTLGRLLAQYLTQFSKARVLLLSTTNSATDQALVAVDRGLEERGRDFQKANEYRRSCSRIGNHFVAQHYVGREHLLPVKDLSLVRKLAEMEARRPDSSDVRAFADWKSQVEGVRADIKRQSSRVLATARLAAMTTTRAVFTFDAVQSLPQYDLVVFDEASQVGLAHALVVAPLGKRVLFAGDPRQLRPIVASDHRHAQAWLGRSAFAFMNDTRPCTCCLREQSRMAEPICELVGAAFYPTIGLTVAQDARGNAAWEAERDLSSVAPTFSRAVNVVHVDRNGEWSQKYKGKIRFASAEKITEIVARIAPAIGQNRILALTPFRAHRVLLRAMLKRVGFRGVRVSTVHRAQGQEEHTVIFDPVDGGSNFLCTDEAEQLINVALSRAKALLIVLLSPGDMTNPLLARIAACAGSPEGPVEGMALVDLVLAPEFPSGATGTVVTHPGLVRGGEVMSVTADGKRVTVLDFAGGGQRQYEVDRIVASARKVGE